MYELHVHIIKAIGTTTAATAMVMAFFSVNLIISDKPIINTDMVAYSSSSLLPPWFSPS